MSNSEQSVHQRLLALFHAGASKSEMAKAIGVSRRRIGRMLADAMRGAANGKNT